MNDEHEAEARLRDAFHRESLPAAPASLVAALEDVSRAPVTRRRRGREAGAGGRPWNLLAVAAVLVVGGAVAVSIGGRGPSPVPPATVAPSPAATATRLTYEPQWTADVPFDSRVVAGMIVRMQSRIDEARLVGVEVRTYDGERIVVDIAAGVEAATIRRLVGVTGLAAFVPLGTSSKETGDQVDLASLPPLFDSSTVIEALVVDDQNGQPALNLKLDEQASKLFADYTAAHIGEYFAIVLDGVIVTAPVIQTEIADGEVQITVGGSNLAELEDLVRLASIIRLGPLPVALAEVSSEPVPSATASAAASPAINCESPLPVEGPQLSCNSAVQSALAILPANHHEIASISFVHSCHDVIGQAAQDCFVQLSGTVTVTFVDGSPPVWIAVSFGGGPRIIPTQQALPITLNLASGDVGCDTIRMQYRSIVIHIDPTAADPVWAITDTGVRLRTFWSSEFRGGTSLDPVVYDAGGVVVARDGTTIEIPEGAWPNLAGYFVCPGPDSMYVFSVPAPT